MQGEQCKYTRFGIHVLALPERGGIVTLERDDEDADIQAFVKQAMAAKKKAKGAGKGASKGSKKRKAE